jgi:antitoxin (DNA-binding transcriptional repressor) of toxin-antitoxin stability system
MATTHISEVEAASNAATVFARARAGEEIVIESSDAPDVKIRLVVEPVRRTIAETIARIVAHDKERSYPATMDADFAADLEDIIRNRKPRDTSEWD